MDYLILDSKIWDFKILIHLIQNTLFEKLGPSEREMLKAVIVSHSALIAMVMTTSE